MSVDPCQRFSGDLHGKQFSRNSEFFLPSRGEVSFFLRNKIRICMTGGVFSSFVCGVFFRQDSGSRKFFIAGHVLSSFGASYYICVMFAWRMRFQFLGSSSAGHRCGVYDIMERERKHTDCFGQILHREFARRVMYFLPRANFISPLRFRNVVHGEPCGVTT